MRTLPVIALGLALVLAGCFGGDDDDSGDANPPATSTPVTSTPTGGTGTGGNGTGTGGGGTGTGGNGTGTGGTTTPMKPAPKEVFSGSANFVPSGPPADPQNVKQTQEPFTVAAGYTQLTLNVTYAASAGPLAPPSQGIAVVILDAAGTEIANCPGPTPGAAAPGPCTAQGAIPAAGGSYTPEYRGMGPYTATVSVIAS